NSSLRNSLIATGFPYYDFDRMEGFLELIRSFFEKTRGVRRLGSAATDLAYVACGRFDGFFEYGLSPWDVAAGALLVQEAGG
ncbi:MAG: inositol monophosphatase family protein, partial [Owenweeksia sp.]